MNVFRVWAPRAARVEVVLVGSSRPMDRAQGGWWMAEVAEAGPGTDYRFALDGAAPLPDPRSPHQPEGVHGPSRVVDHDRFAWADERWRGAAPLAAALIYELHVGTFTPAGTFDAAIERLGYLADLGVTHVELLPVAEFPGRRGWGYDGVDLFAPHSAYGGPDGLKRLVDACHGHGLGAILDVVYNHLGPDGNYLSRFGPYFADRYRTPWGEAVNYDGPGSDEVRRFVVDNACSWLEHYHFDGLRLDAVHAIFDMSALHILEELAREVAALEARLGRRFDLIAESDLNDPRLVRSPEAGGYGLDAAWSDDFHHALHAVLTGERRGYYEDFGELAHLGTAYEDVFVYAGRHSPFRGRRHGRRAARLSGHRFVAYLQNHDQVGNRAAGERIGALASVGQLKVGAALVLCAPFVPMIFAGEEWAAGSPFCYFTDHQDPDLARAVTEGRTREFAAFGWGPATVADPQDPHTFDRSKLDWSEPDKEPHAEVLAWYRRLIALRRAVPALSDGDRSAVRASWDAEARWFKVERGPVTVVANLDDARRLVPVAVATVILLASEPEAVIDDAGRLDLPPLSVAILGRHG